MNILSNEAVSGRLKTMLGWSYQGNSLVKKFTFLTFFPGIAFVDRIAQAAEAVNHHPDITIRYNVVEISLSTHSAGGVTEKDFDLAGKIDQLFSAASAAGA